MMTSLFYSRIISIMLVSVFTITGCHPNNRFVKKAPTVNTIDEVGSVRVSVTSVAPWNEYVDALQPAFKITPKKALEEVAPTTLLASSKTINATGFNINAALPTSISTTTLTTSASGEISEDSGTTESKAPGDISSLAGSSTGSSAPLAKDLAGFSALDKSLLGTLDPRIKYRAATALYQEVQLLDRYIRDTAMRTGYIPYIVRFQVTLMPRLRNLPYDAYINMGFFVDTENKTSGKGKLPVVIPLIATDSLETSMASVLEDRIRQFGLALQMLSQTAIGASLGHSSDQLEEVLGRDINSTFTLGRLSDNTVRVRIGALQQVTEQYAMVPRTESVTLLVLVPEKIVTCEPGKLLIRTYNEMIHTTKIKTLKAKPNRVEKKDIERLTKLYGLPDQCIQNAWERVLENNWGEYSSLTSKYCNSNNKNEDKNKFCSEMKNSESREYLYPYDLWLDLAGLQMTYGVDVLTVEIPKHQEPELFITQTVSLNDDGKESTVVLRYGAGLSESQLCGELRLFNAKNNKVIDHILPVSSFSITSGGRQGVLKLASLKTLELDGYARGKRARLALATDKTASSCFAAEKQEYQVIYRLVKAKPSQGYKQLSVLGFVVTNKGEGELILKFTPDARDPAETVHVQITGAIVKEVISKGSEITPGTNFTISLKGLDKDKKKLEWKKVTIKLAGLVAGKKISIQTQNEKKVKSDPLILDILPPTTASK